jgi:hypothetical protein
MLRSTWYIHGYGCSTFAHPGPSRSSQCNVAASERGRRKLDRPGVRDAKVKKRKLMMAWPMIRIGHPGTNDVSHPEHVENRTEAPKMEHGSNPRLQQVAPENGAWSVYPPLGDNECRCSPRGGWCNKCAIAAPPVSA